MRSDVPEPDFPDENFPYAPGINFVGHAGPYFPYDADDPRAPEKVKRAPGFVTAEDYVKGGIVKQYKRKRKR